jgi:hypothetical protein
MFLEGETPSLDVVQERHLEGFHVGPKPILQIKIKFLSSLK